MKAKQFGVHAYHLDFVIASSVLMLWDELYSISDVLGIQRNDTAFKICDELKEYIFTRI